MAVVDVINIAHAERVAAQAEVDNAPSPDLMDAAEVCRPRKVQLLMGSIRFGIPTASEVERRSFACII